MVDTIIFDIGGVYLNDISEENIARGIQEVYPYVKKDRIIGLVRANDWDEFMLGEISEDKYWENFLRRSKLNLGIDKLKLCVRNQLYPIEGTEEIIRALRPNYKLAIISNNSREWSKYIREKYDILDLFDEVIFSAEVGLKKPDPHIYELALEKLKSLPEKCLFIDDKKRNTDVAEKLGFKTIIFDSVYQLKRELTQLRILR